MSLTTRESQSVYAVPVLGPGSNATGRSNASGASSHANATNTETIRHLQQFLQEFRDNETFVYRDRLRANLLRREFTLEVEMGHLIGWNQELAARCRTEPGEILPLVSRRRWSFATTRSFKGHAQSALDGS